MRGQICAANLREIGVSLRDCPKICLLYFARSLLERGR